MPRIARNTGKARRSAVPHVVACMGDYAISQKVRKRFEQGFGWFKTIGGLRKLPMVGITSLRGWVTWMFVAYNLIRLGGIGQWWEASPT